MYGLRGVELKQRVDHVLDLIGLADRQKDRVDKFSGGMKRRVNIGVALLHTPDVIIMDEPTVGIDPQSRRHILDGVKDLNRQGVDGALHDPLYGRSPGIIRPHRHYGSGQNHRDWHA